MGRPVGGGASSARSARKPSRPQVPASRHADSRAADHGGDQRRSRRGAAPEESPDERPRWQDLPPAQRYEVVLTAEGRADLRRLKKQDPKTHKEIQGPGGLFDQLEKTPDLGYPLEDDWEGCFAVHVGRDRYRVIWEMLPAVEDYEGDPEDEVIAVAILRVGPKTDEYGHTIYQSPRPSVL